MFKGQGWFCFLWILLWAESSSLKTPNVSLLRRHVLCPVVLHHYAQYQPAQPQCQGQAHCWEIHLYEPRHQRRWRSARGAAQGGLHGVTTTRTKKYECDLNPRACIWFSLCLIFMQNLYESIKNEPFKIPEDDGNDLTHTFFNPDREGWLLKLGKSAKDVHILKHASLLFSNHNS